MTYQETLDYMYSRLPMYQRVGGVAFKKNLDNILALCEHLGNPQHSFRSIHVAGTNGKGSCTHMLSAIFQASGYKTGLYTSPHLKSFTERVKVDGKEILEEQVVDFIESTRSIIEEISPSFFEITVAMAFDHFAKQEVDIAIIEVGLGGRLDSTNILSPLACLITNIGLDHTDMLGETLPEIAFEKAGIIKENTPVVIGEKHLETTPVFTEQARLKNAPITFAQDNISVERNIAGELAILVEGKFLLENITLDLLGEHQIHNLKGVVSLLQQQPIRQAFKLAPKNTKVALAQVCSLTGLKGRWQKLGGNPLTYCDTGHNEDGLKTIFKQLPNYQFEELHLVLGTVNDKKLEKILGLFPKEATYYFCKPNVPRGLDAEIFKEKAGEYGLKGQTYPSVMEALQAAKAKASVKDFIFVGGSTFVVAEIENL
ncbi:folylpolyglutamate synthase/dihydrofolate synthase family protein [Flammeovirgaceae bacterium SG7u.111]|nr:folylpolyglutamate synthase/dihydrofolate synthase family protein [Flammeovirgaceae bacterium SG7u.132]WPO33195.1 folylpolyglutamate synthase/dihydrofolate synthase family protein [Flammeovirgaceae bacterium SG7u.111]